MISVVVWRLVGASQVVLGLSHALIWRRLGWTAESRKLSPLTARVFAAHTFFIAFVLTALGSLEVLRPDLLETRGGLARLFLGAATVFFTLRLFAQPLWFDPVLLPGSRWRTTVRIVAATGFASYVVTYAAAFARQLR